MSLAVQPSGSAPSTLTQHRLRLRCQQALRREHVLDLGGADAEGEAAERAVRAGVRIAADDRHPGQRGALLGPDHVHDALPPVAERKIGLRAVSPHVGVERLDLDARDRVVDARDPSAASACCDRPVATIESDAPRLASGELQALERLRARHFVHQMAIDVEQRGAVAFGGERRGCPTACRKEYRRSSAHGVADS